MQYGMLCYVLAFILQSYVICPDGVVRIRTTGNDSGRNNTTTDNSLAHQEILFRFICKLWLFAQGRLPTLDEILAHHKYAIFSDDAFGAHRLKVLGVKPEDFIRIKEETYAEFGLTFKPSQHFHTSGLVNGRLDPRHSFLGSSFCWSERIKQYIPYPRLDKICSSLVYTVKKLHNDVQIVRTLALLVLSAPIPWLYREISSFLDFLLENYSHSTFVLPGDLLELVDRARSDPELWFTQSYGR